MYFIEYHECKLDGTTGEAMGDRSVIILDGRESAPTHHNIARTEGKKRGYRFYKLCKGESFTRCNVKTGLHSIS